MIAEKAGSSSESDMIERIKTREEEVAKTRDEEVLNLARQFSTRLSKALTRRIRSRLERVLCLTLIHPISILERSLNRS